MAHFYSRRFLCDLYELLFNCKMKEFGEKKEGVIYQMRPTVLGISTDKQGKVAVVEHKGFYFLPGGGVENGESFDDALQREFLEEVGWSISIGERICEAAEYLYASDEETFFCKEQIFFLVKQTGAIDPRRKCEHDLHWLTIEKFALNVSHQSHIWAVQKALV